ncbi:MAG: hypothetical protein J5U17_10915 [Candidatus Methanoperedens sp.]|nr:hypothetical protein [Candidatus Methanoperedens sp.]
MRFIESDKAAVEVLGHVIIIGITITGIALIMLVGVPSIYHMQDMITIRNAEQAFTVLDSRASKVALGDSIQQLMNINLGGGTVTVVPNSSSDPSYMLFEMKNATMALVSINISMGKIIYRMGDREVAYEGGGVWSKYPEGSIMLSPPEFNYNGITITLPVLTISGNSSTSGKGAASIRIEKKADPVTLYPDPSKPDYVNPLSLNVSVTKITIKSEYYDAWGEYFRSITLADVVESPVNKTVFVTLGSPEVVTNFSYGALASDTIELGNGAETDSYNSSKGKYDVSKSNNGSIRATREIQFGNKANVNGSAMTGGDITFTSGSGGTIMKDAYARTIDTKVSVSGNRFGKVSGFSLGNTANLVQGKINDYKASRDNYVIANCFSGTELNVMNDCQIDGGNYYLTRFDIQNNKKLTFNTSERAINIGVDAPINLNTGANITLTGSHPVRLYLNKNIVFGNNINLNYPTYNDISALFQVISSSPQKIEFGTGSEFCGFIWAPDAEIDNGNNAELFGAVVGRKFEIGTGPVMHYDEALQNLANSWGEGTKLVYLFITRYDAEVSIS